MKTFFIATSNSGKQKEIKKYASLYGKDIELIFPDSSNTIEVEESGSSFEENALLKARAYQRALQNTDYIYVGDDSGITIPALNGEPGVYTRRWAGYEMTDEEILELCLKKMIGLTGEERRAVFKTVLATVSTSGATEYYSGAMNGHILPEPLKNVEPQSGFPFRSVFWVDDINLPIFEVHNLGINERGTFLTHREQAFKQLFSAA